MLTTKTRRSNKTMTFFVCFLAALAGLLFGLDIGVIAGALPFIANEFQISAHTRSGGHSMMFGAAVGAVGSGWLSFKLGRKESLMIGAILRRRFAVLSPPAPKRRRSLLVSRMPARPGGGRRLIYGSAVSVGNRPRKIRGGMISHAPVMITIGSLAPISLTPLSATAAHGADARVIIIPAVLLLIGVIFLPTSRAGSPPNVALSMRNACCALRDTSAEAKRETMKIR